MNTDSKAWIWALIASVLASFVLGVTAQSGCSHPPDSAHTSMCEETCFPRAPAAVCYSPAVETWSCACYDPDDTSLLHVQTEGGRP